MFLILFKELAGSKFKLAIYFVLALTLNSPVFSQRSISVNLLYPIRFLENKFPDLTLTYTFQYKTRREFAISLLSEQDHVYTEIWGAILMGGESKAISTLNLKGLRLMPRIYGRKRGSFFHGIYAEALGGHRLTKYYLNAELKKKESTDFGMSLGGGWSFGLILEKNNWILQPQAGIGLAWVMPTLYVPSDPNAFIDMSGFTNDMMALHPCFLYVNIGRRF